MYNALLVGFLLLDRSNIANVVEKGKESSRTRDTDARGMIVVLRGRWANVDRRLGNGDGDQTCQGTTPRSRTLGEKVSIMEMKRSNSAVGIGF